MAVGAKNAKVLNPIVIAVTIYMVEFHRNTTV